MWPWGHLALGYLCYTLFSRLRYRRPPDGVLVFVLAFGTQFPDLVDKPLAYWTPLLPAGRTLAHSLLFTIPLLVGVLVLAHQADWTRAGVAFAVGDLSHLVGDSFRTLLAGRYEDLSFLLWPALPLPDYEKGSFLEHWNELVASLGNLSLESALAGGVDSFAFGLLLMVFVVGVWVVDGAPGLMTLETALRSAFRSEPRP